MQHIKKASSKKAKDATTKISIKKTVSRHKTPWEIASKLMAKVPEEAWDNVPVDLSINVDHYLYKTPKLNQP